MLVIIFWIFWILCLIGVLAPVSGPYWTRGSWVLALLLIGILGFKLFGNPIH